MQKGEQHPPGGLVEGVKCDVFTEHGPGGRGGFYGKWFCPHEDPGTRGTGQGVQGRAQSRGLHRTVGACPKDESKRGPRDRPCLALNSAPQSPDPGPLQTSHWPNQPFWLPCRYWHESEPPEGPAQTPSSARAAPSPSRAAPRASAAKEGPTQPGRVGCSWRGLRQPPVELITRLSSFWLTIHHSLHPFFY